MNKILVEVSVGELLDKISILEIKKVKIKDPKKLEFINDEYNILKSQLDQNVKSGEKLDNLLSKITSVIKGFFLKRSTYGFVVNKYN